jgi:hypothetical protein
MGDPFAYERFQYLDPDPSLYSVDQQARSRAAESWSGIEVRAAQSPHHRSKAYFQDALGAGFFLPGCGTCVSDHARAKLESDLGDQARFLPISVIGAPMPYWILYATRYFDGIDLDRSRVRAPAEYIADRRLELREPYFPATSELEELIIFRVAGTKAYVPFALGDYVTQRFLELVRKHNLGGFSFARVRPYREPLAPDEAPILISRGPRYKPTW